MTLDDLLAYTLRKHGAIPSHVAMQPFSALLTEVAWRERVLISAGELVRRRRGQKTQQLQR